MNSIIRKLTVQDPNARLEIRRNRDYPKISCVDCVAFDYVVYNERALSTAVTSIS